MIEMIIKDDDIEECRLRITEVGKRICGSVDYIAEVTVDRGGALGFHRRHISMDPKKYNTMGLVRLALESFDDYSYEAEDGPNVSADLARRLSDRISEVQRGEG